MPARLLYSLGLFLLTPAITDAGSATWGTNPPSFDWNSATNWMPTTVPNGASDIATFATSSRTTVTFSATTGVDSIVFNPGASTFTITNSPFHPVTISGAGVVNNSSTTQKIVADAGSGLSQLELPAFPSFIFTNSAAAGSNVIYTSNGGVGELGVSGNFSFLGSSSADHATFTIHGSTGTSYASEMEFDDSSTGGNALINLFASAQLTMSSASTVPATLGNAIVTNNGGIMYVSATATLGNAVINNNRVRGQAIASLSVTSNSTTGHATAGNATITDLGASSTRVEGNTYFGATATGGTATIINSGGDGAGQAGGFVTLGMVTNDSPTADAATLIANPGTNGGSGGMIIFGQNSLGGTARCEVFGNGTLDLSAHLAPGLTTGSLEGDGLVFLGARNLTLGTSNLSTAFSGSIADGGSSGGTGGSLGKTGTGALTLSSANSYTGGTTVGAGILAVTNTSGSATGTGAVQVNAGTLGGKGIVAGNVTVGTGTGVRANLSPATGTMTKATFTTQGLLTLRSDATYTYTARGQNRTAQADKVVANGVTINGATFAFRSQISITLHTGVVLTVISNTSATPISGTFANLADGAILSVGGTNFQASYEGGDGNDLTLTVVP